VGCRQWDFGDSTSGANNISVERNPTHDYAKPGTYTVTLKAVDDDGFATATVTGRVTVNP
jgi:PKD repeat protein